MVSFDTKLRNMDVEAKLDQAKKALIDGKNFFVPNIETLVDEFMQLGIDNSEEIWTLLIRLFSEIKPEYYVPSPLLKIEDNDCEGDCDCDPSYESFVFSWKSACLQRELVLKFSLSGEYFYFISLKLN